MSESDTNRKGRKEPDTLAKLHEMMDTPPIFVLLGGGEFLTVKLPGMPTIIKNILSIPDECKLRKEELTEKKLENAMRAVELHEKMNGLNMSEEDLLHCLNSLTEYSHSMDIKPLDSIAQPTISDAATHVSTDNEEEQS